MQAVDAPLLFPSYKYSFNNNKQEDVVRNCRCCRTGRQIIIDYCMIIYHHYTKQSRRQKQDERFCKKKEFCFLTILI